MDLRNLFEVRLERIANLEDFIVLYGKKEDILSNLREMIAEIKKTKHVLSSCVEVLNKFHSDNSEKCKKLIHRLKVQQMLTLQILEKMSDQNCSGENQRSQKTILMSKDVENTPTPNKIQRKLGEQPVMTLADYAKSPYTSKRMRPVALQFTDFERNITMEEFLQVPGFEIKQIAFALY